MRPRHCLPFLMLVALTLTSCSTVRKSADFQKRLEEIKTVAVMDPDIAIERLVFKGDNETLYDESSAAGKQARHTVEEELTNKGFQVIPEQVIQDKLKQNPDVLLTLGKIKDRYSALLGDVQNHFVKKMQWKDFNLSLTSEVNPLVDLLETDSLIFVSGSGFVNSGGETAGDLAKTLLIGAASLGSVLYVEPTAGGQVHISWVDGDNGNLLWHNFSNAGIQYNFTKEKGIKNAVKGAIRPFPKQK